MTETSSVNRAFTRPGLWGALVAASLLVGCGKSPEEQLADARLYMEQKDYSTAVISVKNVLQDNPDSLEARLLLAEMSLALADPQTAEKELERAYDLGANAAAQRALHYRIRLALGNFEEVSVSLAQPGGADGLSQSEAATFKGEAQLGLNRLEEAEASFRAALDLDGANGLAKVGLATAVGGQGRRDEGMELLDQVVSESPELAKGWLMRGQVAVRMGRLEDAQNDLRRAVETARRTPDRMQEFLALATLTETQLGLADLDGATATVNELKTLAGGSPLTLKVAAKVHFAKQEFPEARAALQRVIAANPNDSGATFLLGAVYLAEGEAAQAETYLTQVVAQTPGNLAARKLLAEAQLRQARPESAVEALEPLLESGVGVDSRTSYLASQALLRSGETGDAIELLEQNYRENPQNMQVAMSLGAAYLAARQIDNAVEFFESLPESDDYRRELLLAIAYLAKNESEQAQAQIDRIIERRPDDLRALSLVSDYYIASRQFEKAESYLTKILAAEPANVRANLNVARIALTRGDVATARGSLNKVLEQNPTQLTSLLVLGELALRDGKVDEAADLVERAVEENPEVVMAQVLMARIRLAQNDVVGADQAANVANQRAPDALATLLVMGDVALANRRYREATGYYAKALEARSNLPLVWYQQARAQLALEEREEAKASLEQALELAPNLLSAASLDALVDVAEGRTDDALATARRLQEVYPDLAAPQVLEGEIHFRQEQFAAAAESFERGYALGPTSGIAIRVHQARLRTGGSGVDLLEEWLSKNPDDARVRLLVAESKQRAGDDSAAIEEYQRTIDANANNAVALNNLAWLLNEQGDPQAEGYARQAYELRPDLPQIKDTLGWILVGKGELDEGRRLLEDAFEAMPEDGDVAYHLAVALKKSGDRDRSGELLREVLAADRAFASRADAEALLDEISGQ